MQLVININTKLLLKYILFEQRQSNYEHFDKYDSNTYELNRAKVSYRVFH